MDEVSDGWSCMTGEGRWIGNHGGSVCCAEAIDRPGTGGNEALRAINRIQVKKKGNESCEVPVSSNKMVLLNLFLHPPAYLSLSFVIAFQIQTTTSRARGTPVSLDAAKSI